MELPVIADREVAQVRTDLEARLATERETHTQALDERNQQHQEALAAERASQEAILAETAERHRNVISSFQRVLLSSRQRTEQLAQDVAAVLADLTNLTDRVGFAMQETPDQTGASAPLNAPEESFIGMSANDEREDEVVNEFDDDQAEEDSWNNLNRLSTVGGS